MSTRQRLVGLLRSSPPTARALSEWRVRRLERDPAERALTACLAAVRPGSTVVDAGASIGLYSLAFAHATGSHGRVLAIEPNPADFAKLRTGTWRTCVEPLNLALSDAPGTATLHLPVDDHGSEVGTRASLRDLPGSHAVEVECRTLDSIVPGDADVSLVKVDVEGFEAQVLRGAADTLRRTRATVVCEIEQRHLTGSTIGDVIGLMAGWGYRAGALTVDGPIPWSEFDVERDQSRFVDSTGELFGEWRKAYVNNFVFSPT